MNARKILTITLLFLGIVLAFLPLSAKYSLHQKPAETLQSVMDDQSSYTVDEVARFIVSEDSTIQLIDLRTPDEFNEFSLPGAVNMPYEKLLEMDLESYLNRDGISNVFYSNGDIYANYALTLARGLGYESSYALKGGLNEWYAVVMNSEFTGIRITARENALYEIRSRAGRMSIELNSLPDSLKEIYRAAREIERKQLDGGCE